MTHALVLIAAALVIGTGCDLVVASGETRTLGNGGTVIGSATPNAVEVRAGGTLVVEDANVQGRGRAVDVIPAGPFPAPGAAIRADGGTVRVLKGQISGGNVLVTVDPASFPVPAAPGASPGEVRFAELVGVPVQNAALLAPALDATNATVEIEGGTFVGSGVFGVPNPYLPVSGTLRVFGGRLRMRGGEVLAATMMPPSPLFPVQGSSGSSLSALAADVEITGGSFDAAPVLLAGSRARITGGRFGAGLSIGSLLSIQGVGGLVGIAAPSLPACYEIRGGSLDRIGVSGPDPVFLFGAFNLPAGPVTSPAPSDGRFGPFPPLALSGVLEDGSVIQASLVAPPGTNVTLAPPGGPGCGG